MPVNLTFSRARQDHSSPQTFRIDSGSSQTSAWEGDEISLRVFRWYFGSNTCEVRRGQQCGETVRTGTPTDFPEQFLSSRDLSFRKPFLAHASSCQLKRGVSDLIRLRALESLKEDHILDLLAGKLAKYCWRRAWVLTSSVIENRPE